jgi:hypothetical protein
VVTNNDAQTIKKVDTPVQIVRPPDSIDKAVKETLTEKLKKGKASTQSKESKERAGPPSDTKTKSGNVDREIEIEARDPKDINCIVPTDSVAKADATTVSKSNKGTVQFWL